MSPVNRCHIKFTITVPYNNILYIPCPDLVSRSVHRELYCWVTWPYLWDGYMTHIPSCISSANRIWSVLCTVVLLQLHQIAAVLTPLPMLCSSAVASVVALGSQQLSPCLTSSSGDLNCRAAVWTRGGLVRTAAERALADQAGGIQADRPQSPTLILSPQVPWP